MFGPCPTGRTQETMEGSRLLAGSAESSLLRLLQHRSGCSPNMSVCFVHLKFLLLADRYWTHENLHLPQPSILSKELLKTSQKLRVEIKVKVQIIIYKSECFNTYKNDKQDNAHTIRTQTFYTWWNPTEDVWPLLWRLGRFTGPVREPGWRVFLWRWSLVGGENSLHTKQAARSQSVHHFRICVSFFWACWCSSTNTQSWISPSLRCRAVCTTVWPDSLHKKKNSPSVTRRLITVPSFVMCVCVWVSCFWPPAQINGGGLSQEGRKTLKKFG